jgi:hypothetical protein
MSQPPHQRPDVPRPIPMDLVRLTPELIPNIPEFYAGNESGLSSQMSARASSDARPHAPGSVAANTVNDVIDTVASVRTRSVERNVLKNTSAVRNASAATQRGACAGAGTRTNDTTHAGAFNSRPLISTVPYG